MCAVNYIALQENEIATEGMGGSRGFVKRLSEVNEFNCAGNVRSCAGNRTHSAGLTRVYTKIEKSGPRVFVIQFVTF